MATPVLNHLGLAANQEKEGATDPRDVQGLVITVQDKDGGVEKFNGVMPFRYLYTPRTVIHLVRPLIQPSDRNGVKVLRHTAHEINDDVEIRLEG